MPQDEIEEYCNRRDMCASVLAYASERASLLETGRL
jgi:hypothetical protein